MMDILMYQYKENNMANNPVIPEEDWAIMSPEEKASILFPDISTRPLSHDEKKRLVEMFEMNDLQNG